MNNNWRRIQYHYSRHHQFSYEESPRLLRSMPLWEKHFNTQVCGIPWKTIFEAQNVELMNILCKNVMVWDDSAAKEALLTAKTRYRAKFHETTIEIPLPNPNLYIDDIDWNINAQFDLKVLMDMEGDGDEFHRQREEQVKANEQAYLLNQPLVHSGWGGNEYVIVPTGWGDDDEVVQLTNEYNPSCNKDIFGEVHEKNYNEDMNAWQTPKSGTNMKKIKSNVGYENSRCRVTGSWVWKKKEIV